MGVVYQGYDPVIGRTVAIKTILTEGLDPQEFQEYKARFQREAQAAGALTHPNIVTVYDFGEDNGVLYLAMELLEGKSLDGIIEAQNILPIETIIPMYDQVCSALDHAHAHKIVHRDIKPANIMILESGLVKVTDFGIAKMMSLGMTQAGQILGTPNYMSPEQVKGRSVDGRSDIFSLGVVLYELVTGEKPFGGQNITTVIYKIINENPTPPRELDATIPQGLNYVIAKALAKNADERYQTCRELAEDLKNYKNLGGMTAPSATVVIKAPPIQPPPAEAVPPPVPSAPAPAAAAPVEQPPVRQVSVQVIPPATARPQRQGPSAVLWVLLTVLILGALGGGGYYFLVLKPQQQKLAEVKPVPTPQPPANPATTTPGGTTTGATTGTLYVDSTPGGAKFTIDGQTDAAWVTPRELAFALGPHQVVVSKDGYIDSSTNVTIEAGKTANVNPTLTKGSQAPTEAGGGVPLPGGKPSRAAPAPKVGTLVVNSNPTGATITIDGRSDPSWVTPYTFSNWQAGTYTVTLSKEGFDSAVNSVTVKGGESSSLNPTLTVPTGEINIVTTPPGFDVFIDGDPAGKSPVRRTLPVGPHSYSVRRGGEELFHNDFKIEEGVILTKRVPLGSQPVATLGVVTVRTVPEGASVLADGSPVGAPTPTSFSLSVGPHVLVLRLPGSPPVRVEVEVKAEGITVEKRLR
jgi:hypothetical protein